MEFCLDYTNTLLDLTKMWHVSSRCRDPAAILELTDIDISFLLCDNCQTRSTLRICHVSEQVLVEAVDCPVEHNKHRVLPICKTNISVGSYFTMKSGNMVQWESFSQQAGVEVSHHPTSQ